MTKKESDNSSFMVTGGLSSLEQDLTGDKMQAPGRVLANIKLMGFKEELWLVYRAICEMRKLGVKSSPEILLAE